MKRWLQQGRKSPRLQGYDYARAGAYFVTICTHQRLCLFGEVKAGEMWLNPAGEMVAAIWARIAARYPAVATDLFVVMPNHVHGIVILMDGDAVSLSRVVGWFKTMTTNAYMRGVYDDDWPSFERKLWQRSFHDHIIRNEQDLNRLREYMANNPGRWQDDTFFDSGDV